MGNYLAKYLITALRTFAVLNVAKSCCNLNNSCSFRYRAPYFVYFSAIGNAHRTRSRTNVRTARHILLLNFNLQNRRVLRIPAESEKCLNSAIRDGISPPPLPPRTTLISLNLDDQSLEQRPQSHGPQQGDTKPTGVT